MLSIGPIVTGSAGLITSADGLSGSSVSRTATPRDAFNLDIIDNLVGHTVLTSNTSADATGAGQVAISSFDTAALLDLGFTFRATDTTAIPAYQSNIEHVVQVTINLIDNNTKLMTAADAGTEPGLDGQTMTVDLHNTNPAASFDCPVRFVPENAVRSATIPATNAAGPYNSIFGYRALPRCPVPSRISAPQPRSPLRAWR